MTKYYLDLTKPIRFERYKLGIMGRKGRKVSRWILMQLIEEVKG